jgi:hypothetical protein
MPVGRTQHSTAQAAAAKQQQQQQQQQHKVLGCKKDKRHCN